MFGPAPERTYSGNYKQTRRPDYGYLADRAVRRWQDPHPDNAAGASEHASKHPCLRSGIDAGVVLKFRNEAALAEVGGRDPAVERSGTTVRAAESLLRPLGPRSFRLARAVVVMGADRPSYLLDRRAASVQ